MRKDTKYNIPDCPYNRPGQKTHQHYKYMKEHNKK